MRTPEPGTMELHDQEPSERTAARIIAEGDTSYPATLRDLSNPPRRLHIRGTLETLTPPVVAVVGTRDASEYAIRMTFALCTALARAGGCVVSGLARGIDAAAHRATLAEGGRTAAVLGTGVDVPYPVGHRELQELIARKGLLISEFDSGSCASKGSFPRRNRILAALASVTIVVEAPRKSGALGTAKIALDLGRAVAAVPGPIDSPRCVGSNELIRDGAVVIAAIEDALALVGLTAPVRFSDPSFGEREQRVLRELARAPADLDALAARSRLPARECLQAVTTLELAGAIECLLTGEIRRR